MQLRYTFHLSTAKIQTIFVPTKLLQGEMRI